MFNSIEEALEDLKQGKVIIVCDDENRENEGDLVSIAEYVTPETINFMAKEGRGLICVPITESLANRLQLHPMVETNSDSHGTAFTVSIDHKDTTTGISAFERSYTIEKLMSDEATAEEFNRPGHIFPLIGKAGGVLSRTGHTEAAIDLARLCGAKPAGVICEVMNDDGTMARVDDLMEMAKKFNLKFITIEQLVEYRLNNE